MRLSSARAAVALSTPAGVLAGHALGYMAGHQHAGGHAVDHSYLAGVAGIAAALAVAALAWAAVCGVRRRRPVPIGTLLVAQWTVFAGQEMVEHAIAGHGPAGALRSAPVWFGLAAQAVVAVAVAALLRVAAVAGSRALAALSRPTLVPAGATGSVPAGSTWRLGRAVTTAVPARGPPLLLA